MENERKKKITMAIWLALSSVALMMTEVYLLITYRMLSYFLPVMAIHLLVCVMAKKFGLKWSEIIWLVSSIALIFACTIYVKIFGLILPIMIFLLAFNIAAASAMFRKITLENENNGMSLSRIGSISQLTNFYCRSSSAKLLLLLVAFLVFLETYSLDSMVYDMENFSDTAVLALIPISILLVFTIVSNYFLLFIGGFKIVRNIQKTSLVKYSITVFSVIVPWILLTVFGIFFPGDTTALVVRFVLSFGFLHI